MAKRRYGFVILVACAAFFSAPARAEVILTPFAGEAFGGTTSSSETTYGAGLAFLGGGAFGFEGEFSYVTNFFGNLQTPGATVSSNNVQSISTDFMVAIPSRSLRFYASGGLSLLRPALTDQTGLVVLNSDKLGYNAGGGLMIFLSDHVGLRGDIRFFRAFGALESGEQVSLGSLDFWRGTGGLSFRF